ncbi:hypothetical protein AJ78_02349 [Emergomyces pasteurianus Ep9510]|uniref:Protein kinase domain-containing protein n=1 Tax=Emergomyces pasteurianus Ep9510 TaxID=1447872 RepID=A0A1J9PM76_9EURO|nr:hypothetical protein AJ78_02349 [Emergomyces pasteurianus Ep9510]
MVGMSATTSRIGNIMRKECHILLDEPDITAQNFTACRTEAEVYLILGSHQCIAKCSNIDPEKKYIELEYHSNGNLKGYWPATGQASRKKTCDIERYQMIQSVAYIHSKGVRHSDIRLDQWLAYADHNARLSDFNASGFDDQPDLNLRRRPAQGLESPSHYLPRNPGLDSTVESDLFALGSALYELVTNYRPYETLSNESIEARFRE